MKRLNIWFFYRILAVVLGIFSLSRATYADTNFGPIAGLISGAVGFLFVFFVVSKNSVVSEQMFRMTSPCWPAIKYPQTCWFLFGATLFISAVVNLITHLGSASVSLYVGLLLLGFGMFTGAVVAHYQVRGRK